MRRNFKSFSAFKAFAIRNGLRVRKVTVSKSNIYWQGITKSDGVIVGFFNETAKNKIGTGNGAGSLPAFK